MKSEKEIKEWLESQPYYDTLKANLINSIIPIDARHELLNGMIGEKTVQYATMFLNPKEYNWDKIRQEFQEWYNGQ